MSPKPLTILFSGMLAGDPGQGGATWAVLQYLLGFERLGHSVCLVEPVETEKLTGAARKTRNTSTPHSGAVAPSIAYFHKVTRAFGLAGRCALLGKGTRQTVGMAYDELLAVARKADVLFNVSGMLDDPELISHIPVRVYLDLDPAFVQLWHAVEGVDMRLAGHTHHVTVGLSIGTPACDVPSCGVDWQHTLPPVVLDRWPVASPDRPRRWDALTTIANWRAYGSIHHGDRHYGQKAHSIRQILDLPSRTRERLVLALSIHSDEVRDLAALHEQGWRIVDPVAVGGTPGRYRRFIRESKGELGVAKSGYIVSKSGWFSDRSACYLACGRPVIAQETGFSQHLPTGRGLLPFATAEEAADAIEQINDDYPGHCAAARRLAETHFDSDLVLERLLRITEAGR